MPLPHADKKRKTVSLFAKVTISNAVLGLVILLTTLLVTMKFSINSMEQKIEENLMNTAVVLAKNPMVVHVLENKEPSEELNEFVDYVIEHTEDLAVVTVADENARRLYHLDRSRIGQYFVGGDEERAILGNSYISDATGTMGYQRRAFAPVYGGDGEVIGFVMASTMMTRIENMRTDIYSIYGKMAVILFMVGLTVALILSENIKLSLMGYEPTQFAQIFMAREEVLSSLEEGIVSVDRAGVIMLANGAAAAMLDLRQEEMIGRDVNQIIPTVHLGEVISTGHPQYNRDLITPRFTILYDKIPIKEEDNIIGAVAILRNKTEATRLAEQLTGSKHIISALRANTHEFMNKLHVILGLLQMGKADEASGYINNVSQIQSETISPVLQRIQNPTVAALILGRISHMRELSIDLTLLPESDLPVHSRFLSTRNLVTIIGNLMENAIESINEKDEDSLRRIVMQVREDAVGLMISVDDSGVGMTQEEVAKIFLPGYSTKGESRGTGMVLVKGILDDRGGVIEVESEKGEGTSITVSVQKARQ